MVATVLVSGCAGSPDMGGALSQITDNLKSSLPNTLTGGTTGHFKDSGLYHALKDGGNGWPRAAIMINSLPRDAYSSSLATNLGSNFHYGPGFCLNASIVLWRDATHSQRFDGVRFCGNDIPDHIVSASTSDFLLWGGSLAPNPNTGTRRTNGPNPPKSNFPQGSGYVGSFAGTNGMNLFAQFMYAMSYDLAGNSDDHRAWVVTMPSASQMNY